MNTIEEYLARLRAELAGADPAVVQDALYDAEEYLRAEAPDATSEQVAAAIDAYGTPDEIATAYLAAERRIAPAARPAVFGTQRDADEGAAALARRFFGVVADPRTWGALFYLLLAFVTGIVYFTIVVTGLSLSAGLIVLIIGVPFMLIFLATVRALSLMEGRLVEALLGERMPRRPRGHVPQGNLLERIKMWLTDVRTWTSMLYMVLQMPLGVAYFTAATAALGTSAALIAMPVFQWVTRDAYFYSDSYAYYFTPFGGLLAILGGVLLFFATLHGARLVGKLHAMYAKAMLVGRADPDETTAAAPVAA